MVWIDLDLLEIADFVRTFFLLGCFLTTLLDGEALFAIAFLVGFLFGCLDLEEIFLVLVGDLFTDFVDEALFVVFTETVFLGGTLLLLIGILVL